MRVQCTGQVKDTLEHALTENRIQLESLNSINPSTTKTKENAILNQHKHMLSTRSVQCSMQ